MKTTIRADVALWDVEVFAQMVLWEPRPELQRLCAAVPHRGKLGPAEVEAALPGLSEAAQKNIIRRVNHLKLVNDDGSLTKFGENCAEHGEAPAWELGTYSFLTAVHPMFTSHVLDFNRVVGDSQDNDFSSLAALPDWFKPTPTKISKSAFDPTFKFTLDDLPTQRSGGAPCRARERGSARLVWDIDLDTGVNTSRIEGEIHGQKGRKPFSEGVRSQPAEDFGGVFASWEKRFNRATGRVEVPYDAAAVNGHDTFLRELTYPHVSLGKLGSFSDVRVEDIPVGPGNAGEARQWGLALLSGRISAADAYVTRDGLMREWQSVIRGTPLEPHLSGAVAPTSEEAAGKTASARARWLLRAAADLTTGG
jgi:hypothetical protein